MLNKNDLVSSIKKNKNCIACKYLILYRSVKHHLLDSNNYNFKSLYEILKHKNAI